MEIEAGGQCGWSKEKKEWKRDRRVRDNVFMASTPVMSTASLVPILQLQWGCVGLSGGRRFSTSDEDECSTDPSAGEGLGEYMGKYDLDGAVTCTRFGVEGVG